MVTFFKKENDMNLYDSLHEPERKRKARREGKRASSYGRFLHTVEELGALSPVVAERATVAVLGALEHRLFGDFPRKLESQLPATLRDLLAESPLLSELPPERIGREQLIDLVAIQMGATPEDAERLTRIVLAAVRMHISPGEVIQVSKHLPQGIAHLWLGRSV
jgi:uncharacterized protein (DUF2267 family)